jgi:hypothetical protein
LAPLGNIIHHRGAAGGEINKHAFLNYLLCLNKNELIRKNLRVPVYWWERLPAANRFCPGSADRDWKVAPTRHAKSISELQPMSTAAMASE